MSMNPPDQDARNLALDPHQSFIVQAPAGSGKTELLTQRYLVLLAHAKQVPEEIIAITFTRKAAAEMRARIIAALQSAAEQPEPKQANAQKTWLLARAALHNDHALKWNILDNPQRLRILTIDGLCAHLVRQLPLLSGLGGTTTVIDDPIPLYQQAVRKLLANLESTTSWVNALEVLLQHLDNDYEKAERLLIDMLAKRDQWLPYLAETKDSRHLFEAALTTVLLESMESIATLLPRDQSDKLINLARFAAVYLPSTTKNPEIASCKHLIALPCVKLEHHEPWKGIAALLLTQSGQWRKKITINEGFPSKASAKNKVEAALFSQMKQDMEQLLDSFSTQEALRQALFALQKAPPIHFTEQQWRIIEALIDLLPLLVAYLQVEFQFNGTVDYIEIANRALAALGEPENPTDLALALDYRIQHILVDEFQDTSSSQYRLLEQLTSGWESGDGRTLFLVGDPMQSIYRFRKAEVGLFLRAREIGIGHIRLKSLHLLANFRSHTNIVEWINNAFQRILPTVENIATGAVAYYPSIATHHQPLPASVKVYPFYAADFSAEAAQIVSIIQQSRNETPHGSIAILVRAKNHLNEIFPALRKAQIAYKAIDIVPLFHHPVVQDLFALTRAFLHLADRTAWLALLRAPWCNLNLTDLHTLVGNNHHCTVWEQLQHYQDLPLSLHGSKTLETFMSIMQHQMVYRGRVNLRHLLEDTWHLLGGPHYLDSDITMEDTDTFFTVIDQLQSGGTITDLDQLVSRLKNLYASTSSQGTAQVEIMTIHKAKGLEFDTVILPGLGRGLPSDDHQLLLWMEYSKKHGGTNLLVAPIRAMYEAIDPIYNYLRAQEAKKNENETARLLYVATTRAKTHLHLLGHCAMEYTENDILLKVNPKSLLEQLWPLAEPTFKQLAQKLPV